jgi:lipopolysaccharide/colanic/teichoic acid biosynthesis glycosyltransferase
LTAAPREGGAGWRHEPAPAPLYALGKRAFDVGIAGMSLVVLSPLLLAIAIAIKLTSRGPVLYRGVRTGRDGIPFEMLKFRTMVPDAEQAGTTTRLGDPRITSVGRLLRRAKLDELPQLINVLGGTMSLVGPRPEVAEHTDAYDDAERAILSVTPGITDFSSIHFVSLDEVLGTENPHEVFVTRIRAEKNQLRLKYVRERSFLVDLRILAGTVRVVLRKILASRA